MVKYSKGDVLNCKATLVAHQVNAFGVMGGGIAAAIWHGKRWMKECGKTGTITAIPAIDPEPYQIIEW